MNKTVKSYFVALLLLTMVALLAMGILFRPSIVFNRETSLVGPEDGIIPTLGDGELSEIQKSVARSGKKVDDISWMGGSLLYWAVEQNREDVAKWLLSEGASPNGIHPAMSPLSAAISDENVAVVKLLLSYGADPDLDPGSGVTPRAIADFCGNTEIIAALPPPSRGNPSNQSSP